jgi:hypothetical protein
VNLASRGQRDMDGGAAAITDATELAQVQRQARSVKVKGLLTAIVLTAAALAIPE